MELFVIFVFWALMCWGVAALASSRGRSGVGFFLLSFLFSPLLGLIIVLVMKDLAAESARETDRRREEERREFDRQREHEKQLESLRAVTTSQANRAAPGSSESTTGVSVADELTKLAALRDKGILSPEEFDQQKKQLLGRPLG